MSLDVSPDGATIVFDLLGDIYVMPIEGGEATRLTSGPAYDVQPRFSPDGRRIAFTSTLYQGRWHVFAAEVTPDGRAERVTRLTEDRESGLPRYYYNTVDADVSPTWSPDGRELFYVNGKTELIAAEIRPGATFSVGEQRRLFSVDAYLRPGSCPRYAVSRDGRRFMMIREGQLSQQSELILAENWLQVLRAKP